MSIKLFFETNIIIVFFIYGLSFFALGLVTALQSRQHSQLELARNLGWLSAFGFTHGLHEWGVIFIPIQSTYLGESTIIFLKALQAILLALSYSFLFQFGIGMMRNRWPRLLIFPLLIATGWSLWFFIIPGPKAYLNLETWLLEAMIWARYIIGFPGGIVAALGLLYQARQINQVINNRAIYKIFRVAGFMLVAFAIFSGLLGPKADFFPANFINGAMLVQFSGVPAPVFRSLISLVLSIALIRALEVFDLETAALITNFEIECNLKTERERIGRELHDQTIQNLYVSGLLVDSVKRNSNLDEKNEKNLDRALGGLDNAITSLRKYLGKLQPDRIDSSLAVSIRTKANDARFSSLFSIDLEIDLPKNAVFEPTRTHHILEILGESLSNIARHANAKRVNILVTRIDGDLELVIVDDGKGFEFDSTSMGFGLRNMRDRARLLGGKLVVDSHLKQGTKIKLLVPWEEIK